MGELRQIHKFSNVSRSIEILTELAKLGATKYNTFAISRVAKTFGVDRALVRSNAERNELLLEFVHNLMNETALLKVELEAMKERDGTLDVVLTIDVHVFPDLLGAAMPVVVVG